MVIGQIFGSMLVQGILCKEIDSLKFSWTSFRTIYATFFLISGSIEAGMVTVRLVRMGLNLNYAQGIIFFVSSMLRSYLLFHMARKWKTIMKYERLNDLIQAEIIALSGQGFFYFTKGLIVTVSKDILRILQL